MPESMRIEMSGIIRPSSLNRTVPALSMTISTKSDHLLPKRATTLRIGQISIIEFLSALFFIFTLYFAKLHTKLIV